MKRCCLLGLLALWIGTIGCEKESEKPASEAGQPASEAGPAESGPAETGPEPAPKPEPMVGPPYNSCNRDSDCAWGEIPHEIEQASDCICLYGCPYLALSKETVDRRVAQAQSKCNPRQDGQGQPCGIDDCNMPPPAVCSQGACGAADAGSR
jgi:hypothetical protein